MGKGPDENLALAQAGERPKTGLTKQRPGVVAFPKQPLATPAVSACRLQGRYPRTDMPDNDSSLELAHKGMKPEASPDALSCDHPIASRRFGGVERSIRILGRGRPFVETPERAGHTEAGGEPQCGPVEKSKTSPNSEAIRPT
jgi:hypothetical protein